MKLENFNKILELKVKIEALYELQDNLIKNKIFVNVTTANNIIYFLSVPIGSQHPYQTHAENMLTNIKHDIAKEIKKLTMELDLL